ncbi:uncharacterized protein LOC131676602 [Topomyia yanbarensis]|uniref:uncharacterized protein LOC131676602 n=1 Tax=Topomyia yanbarensis TaxID=2498891 RepID=UPI00273C7451|nr:uncharacterized protein LOC131676602 [Topomyia yanbarensis]
MAAIMKFVFLLATASMVVNAAPSKKSIADVVEVTEEFRVRFEELSQEKEQMLQFARTALFATYRHMNEDMLIDLGNTRNTIDYGFDETRTLIAEKLLMGGDEDCLLDLVSQIRDEQRALASGMSVCAAGSNDAKDELASSFLEVLILLQRLATAQTEIVLWSYTNYNSVVASADHADYLRRTFGEMDYLWNTQVKQILQFEIDAMEHNRPILVAQNLDCLDKLPQQLLLFDEQIRSKISTCAAPLKV